VCFLFARRYESYHEHGLPLRSHDGKRALSLQPPSAKGLPASPRHAAALALQLSPQRQRARLRSVFSDSDEDGEEKQSDDAATARQEEEKRKLSAGDSEELIVGSPLGSSPAPKVLRTLRPAQPKPLPLRGAAVVGAGSSPKRSSRPLSYYQQHLQHSQQLQPPAQTAGAPRLHISRHSRDYAPAAHQQQLPLQLQEGNRTSKRTESMVSAAPELTPRPASRNCCLDSANACCRPNSRHNWRLSNSIRRGSLFLFRQHQQQEQMSSTVSLPARVRRSTRQSARPAAASFRSTHAASSLRAMSLKDDAIVKT
jgi:hypothetical protein